MCFRQRVFWIAGTLFLTGTLCAQMPQGQNPQGYPQQNPQGYPQAQQQPGMGNPTNPGMGPSDTTQRQPADRMASDKKFVQKAAEGNMAEVELGKLAQEKASSDAVKQFGARMEQDHTKANQDLQQAASAAHIDVPNSMSNKDQKLQEKLSKLSGPAFDREYVKAMVTDHKTDLKAFERESHSGKAPQIREFASNILPTLQDHLKSAEQLTGGGGARMSSK